MEMALGIFSGSHSVRQPQRRRSNFESVEKTTTEGNKQVPVTFTNWQNIRI